MNKSMLLKMRKITATPTMVGYAKNDKLHTQGQYSWGNTQGYNVGRYLRCTVERDILKVAIFLTEHMRAGGKLPAYEIYLDTKKGDFITYDCIQQKWRNAKADLLPWPSYVHYSYNDWMSEKGYWKIKKLLRTSQGGFPGILEFQLRVRADQLKQRHKRETDPWDMELAQTKPLPKDWNRWVRKVGISENYIFYHYDKKGAKTGYCSYCEKEVPIKHPKHNKSGKCPRCRHSITFKAVGRMGSFSTETAYLYLIQRCDVGFMIREFEGCRRYYRGDYQNPDVSCWESRRAIFDQNARQVSAYWWGAYKQQYTRWIKTGVCAARSYYWENGKVYGKSLPTLFQKELKETGLQEFLKKNPSTDPERYLAYFNRVPFLEKMVKADLPVLVKECFLDYSPYQRLFWDTKETSLVKAMGIDGARFKRLKESGRGISYLQWLRYEKAQGLTLPDALIKWFVDNNADPSSFGFLNRNMSFPQIQNYIRRQMTANNQVYRWVISTWTDTLSMAKRLGKNLNDPYVFRPSDLHGRHQAYVRTINELGEELLIMEQERNFPQVNSICASIQDLYSYSGETYMVIVPNGVSDIVREGKKLEHCVGDNRYMERIETRESYILFLRKRTEPTTAYYTLEVEPDGTVRQKRTTGDVQNADIEEAKEFLVEWQKEVAKRLTFAEQELAARSKVLRLESFAEMDQNNTIIRTGALRGQRLVDVLMADLMENTEVAAAPELAAAA